MNVVAKFQSDRLLLWINLRFWEELERALRMGENIVLKRCPYLTIKTINHFETGKSFTIAVEQTLFSENYVSMSTKHVEDEKSFLHGRPLKLTLRKLRRNIVFHFQILTRDVQTNGFSSKLWAKTVLFSIVLARISPRKSLTRLDNQEPPINISGFC